MNVRGYGQPKITSAEEDNACSVSIPKTLTNNLFPWHFAFNTEMNIVSVGKHLAHRFQESQIGKQGKRVFRMVRPVDIGYDFESFKDLDGVPCTFSVDAKLLRDELTNSAHHSRASSPHHQFGESCPFSNATSGMSSSIDSKASSADLLALATRMNIKLDNLKLHGQMTFHEEQNVVIFLGTPALRSLEEMEAQRIELAELPLHSHGREFLYGSMFQSTSAQNSNEVDTRLAELDKSMEEIQEKKEQINNLLHSILPPVCCLMRKYLFVFFLFWSDYK